MQISPEVLGLIGLLRFAVLIDRECTRCRLRSAPYQLSSIGLCCLSATFAKFAFESQFPEARTSKFFFPPSAMDVAGYAVIIAAGMAGCAVVYLLVRTRCVKADLDYDDETLNNSSHIADIPDPRDGDDIAPR